MQRAAYILLTALVFMYSQSSLVIWSLYTIERHDIILYYGTESDLSSGTVYMQSIEDASRGHHAACTIVKIMEHTIAPPVVRSPLTVSDAVTHVALFDVDDPHKEQTFHSSVFRPPRTLDVHTSV